MTYRSQIVLGFRLVAIFIVGYVTLLARPSSAVPVPAFDIDSILGSSDLAAVVKPTDQPGKVKVIRVYLGPQEMEQDVIDVTTSNPMVLAALEAKREMCIFLRKAGANEATFSPAGEFYPFFHVLPKRQPTDLGGKEAIESELIAGLGAEDLTVVEDSVLWLKRMGSEKGREEIISRAREISSPQAIRAFAFEARIPEGRKEVIEGAVGFLEETVQHRNAEWRSGLVRAFFDIKRTNDVHFLNELLIGGPNDIARALAYSARDWAVPASIPYLIRALDRFEREREYRCILALHKLTGRWAPGHRDFMADPDKYVEDWKSWWRAGQAEDVEHPGAEPSETAQTIQEPPPEPNAGSLPPIAAERGWSPIAYLLFGIAIGAGAAGVIALAKKKPTGRTQ